MTTGKQYLKTWLLIIAASVLAGVAYFLVPAEVVETRPQTILWVAPPTSMVTWQRFVQALQAEYPRWAEPDSSLDISQVAPNFPGKSPEVTMRLRGETLRWQWSMQTGPLEELMSRDIGKDGKVLAVIGGATTESAIQLALALREHSVHLPEKNRPILLLQTATADRIYPQTEGADRLGDGLLGGKVAGLMDIYKGKTFRFGFNNKRIAEVVTSFVRELYQPIEPSSPSFVVWEDDPYGLDVLDSFRGAFEAGGKVLPVWTNPVRIKTGVASLDIPNRHETKAAGNFANELGEARKLGRPWIVMGGQADPCRRFLAALSGRQATKNSKDLPLVAFGDTPGFNRIFRDQRLMWPLEDIPFELVFFCHQDPASYSSGFNDSPIPARKWESNSTDDLLLWENVVGGVLAAWRPKVESRQLPSPADFGDQLARIQVLEATTNASTRELGYLKFLPGDGEEKGKPFFDEAGDRLPGTGEHVVHVEPKKGGANIRVVSLGSSTKSTRRQRLIKLEGENP